MDTRRLIGSVLAYIGAIVVIVGAVVLAVAYTRNPISNRYHEHAFDQHNGLGNVALYERKYPEAISEFSAMSDVFPERGGPYMLRAMAKNRAGMRADAVQDFTKALELMSPAEIKPGSDIKTTRATLLYDRGNTYEAMGKHDLAITDFNEALRLNPEIPDARSLLAEAYLHAKHYRECVEAATIVIDGNQPYSYRALMTRAEAEGNLKRPDQSANDLARVTYGYPNFALGWANRGWYEYQAGELWPSVESSTRALDLNRTMAFAWFNLGLSYTALGDRTRAKQSYAGGLLRSARGTPTGATGAPESRAAAIKDLRDALGTYPKSAALTKEALGWVTAGTVPL